MSLRRHAAEPNLRRHLDDEDDIVEEEEGQKSEKSKRRHNREKNLMARGEGSAGIRNEAEKKKSLMAAREEGIVWLESKQSDRGERRRERRRKNRSREEEEVFDGSERRREHWFLDRSSKESFSLLRASMGFPAVRPELDLVEQEGHFTHEISLEDEIDPESNLDFLKPNPHIWRMRRLMKISREVSLELSHLMMMRDLMQLQMIRMKKILKERMRKA